MKIQNLVGMFTAPVLGLAACAGGQDGPTASMQINVAPLELPGIGNAIYTVTVMNGAQPTPEMVWTRTLSSDRFGDGIGSLSYVGPCDAQENPHSVTLTLDELYDVNGLMLVSPGDYMNPGTMTLSGIECQENADVPVTFNLTIVRSARQGFFDIGVNLKDVFCSAKVDCNPAFLHNPDGERDATVIVALACTSGSGTNGADPTWLYLSPLTLTCVDPTGQLPPLTQVVIPGNATGEGNQGAAPPMLFQWALYSGLEGFQDINKCYWNHALGLNLQVIGPRRCTLTATGAATDEALVNSEIAADAVFPVISFEVDVLDENGNLCSNNGLNQAGSGVITTYVTPSTEPRPAQFSSNFLCGGTGPTPVGTACGGGDDMLMQPAVGPQGEAGITLTVGGVASAQAYLLPPGASFGGGCCLDNCCQP